MNRDALGPALIALLAVVALGVGASALDSPDVGRGEGGVGIRGDGTGIGGEGETVDLGRPPPPPTPASDSQAIPPVVHWLLGALVVGAFLVSLYLARDELGKIAVLSVLFVFAAIVLFYLFTLLDPSIPKRGRGGILGDRDLSLPGGGAPGDVARTVTNDPSLLAVVVGVVLVCGVLALLFFGTDDDPESESDSESAEPDAAMAGIGRAAGQAADRIAADAAVENEVYRAWREMTTHLDIENPQSSTPREFARAATDAGMAREDTDELTDLFITTRYGGRTATAERETRAVAALRRIEDEYGEPS